jgi:hypothetical protein
MEPAIAVAFVVALASVLASASALAVAFLKLSSPKGSASVVAVASR